MRLRRRDGLHAALCLALAICACCLTRGSAQESGLRSSRVVVDSEGWRLVGDLLLPASQQPVAAVLLFNQADGDRTVYAELARALAGRGIASLRLDLRGHGESTNLGRFVPGEVTRDPLIWDAESDVHAAHEYLQVNPRIAADRIGILGASYSGEEMAEAGRLHGYAQAYVALSPGSFSDASVSGIDASGVPWLFVTSRDDRFLVAITASVQQQSETAELLFIPGKAHASDLLVSFPDMAERIATWLAHRL